MKVAYTEEEEERRLYYENGFWSGEDPEMVEKLNGRLFEWLGYHEYFPTEWHVAKAVADKLGGEVDEPEPNFPTGPHRDGRMY